VYAAAQRTQRTQREERTGQTGRGRAEQTGRWRPPRAKAWHGERQRREDTGKEGKTLNLRGRALGGKRQAEGRDTRLASAAEEEG